VLVFGSLPGEASLAARRYYAHPTNQFWRLVGSVIGSDIARLDYAARLAALNGAGIGLWDVVGSARREGSLDTAIRDIAGNDLAQLIAGLPELRAIGFNGGAAARVGRRLIEPRAGLALIDLPSSSAAYCRIDFPTKAQSWGCLREFL
jgi:TDG/mug DNA glycosylase family protein